MGCLFLFQGIFLTQGLNPPLLCLLHWQVVLYQMWVRVYKPARNISTNELNKGKKKKFFWENFHGDPVVKFPKAGSVGSIPGLPTRILDASWCGQKEKFSHSVCMSPGLGGLVRKVRLLLAHQNGFWGIGSGQRSRPGDSPFLFWWMEKFLSVVPWGCGPWIFNCRDRELQVLGSEPYQVCTMFAMGCSQAVAVHGQDFKQAHPWDSSDSYLGLWACPLALPNFPWTAWLPRKCPPTSASLLLSLLHSESDLHHGPRARSAFPEALHAPSYTLLACFILSWCLLLAGPK